MGGLNDIKIWHLIKLKEPLVSQILAFVAEMFAMYAYSLQVVSDQIRLWQAETQRVQHFKAHMYDSFESEELFHKTAEHTKLMGTWLWQDNQNQRLVAQSEGHDQTREFIRNNR